MLQVETGLALASSQIASGHLVSPLATERAGVVKLATGVRRGVWQVKSSEYLGMTYQKDIKDIGLLDEKFGYDVSQLSS